MDMHLSENIRKFRKEHRLTQEQLAEVLGVTTGAVHKWEAGMSVPDISLIMELADFFDTSVDVLLGYKMKDNSIESTMKRMGEMCQNSNPEALTEAEKMLKKYPNSFKTVHFCAVVYGFFGVGKGKEAECQRALELFEQARLLIKQNTDPCISEETIMGNIAMVYTLTGEYEKAVEVMKKHNPNGMFSDNIGLIMALDLNKTKESAPYLVEGIIQGFGMLLNSIFGFTAVLCFDNDFSTAKKMVGTAVDLMKGLYGGEEVSFADKEYAMAYILLAYTYLKTGERDVAKELIKKTVYHVNRFDAAPNYSLGKFIFDIPKDFTTVSRDIMGESAKESIETLLKYIHDPEMDELWKLYY